MKYLAKSQNGKMIQIGDDLKKGKWFYLDSSVGDVINTLNIGDDVTYNAEPRGGAFYVTFLAKGTVEAPKQEVKKPVVLATPTKTYPNSNTKTSTTTSHWNKEDKVDWDGKELRDYKGRCIVYASSIMGKLIENHIDWNSSEEDFDNYFKKLFIIADKLREYIYTK